ncbi:MAG: glycosyltransferase family 2 protein [Desulfamplus sp.]
MNKKTMPYKLAVVMPVYNEEECIVDVINSWVDMLLKLNIKFKIIVLNDGSTDNTVKALEIFKTNENIHIVDKKNSGHGPTILMGYKMAVEIADWIFQCDSDDEMKAEDFPKLWQNCINYDVLFGIRHNRKQNVGRKIISMFSRVVVKELFGKSISDVNVPYRLMSNCVAQNIIDKIPENTFAPNIIISGMIAKYKYRVYETLIPHYNRKTGKESLVQLKLWKMALKSFKQTILVRFSYFQQS